MYPELAKLKTILIEESYVSEEDSRAAEASSRTPEEYIGYLIGHDLLSKSLLGQALAESFKLPFIDLGTKPLDKEVAIRLPEPLARAHRAALVSETQDALTLATDNPTGFDAKGIAGIFPKKKIELVYTLPEYITASFALFEQPLETRFSKIITEGRRVAPEIVDEIMKDALAFHASDIHFEPQGDETLVRFRIDGNLREAGKIAKEYYENILNRIKVEGAMRIDEHFSAQDGAIRYAVNNQPIDLRVSLVPTIEGEKIVMRVRTSYVQDFTLSDIGLNTRDQALLQAAATKPFGMILTVGPTGSGKTTTLYTILKSLAQPNVNITTIEDPVEYKIKGINQIQVREASGMGFAKGLRAIVRQDPDIILVGEIRDHETAEISVNAALTGHLLLSTFHANDAATAAPRLLDMGIEPYLLASTLEVIIAQRLVRQICPQCRYSLSAKEVLKAFPATLARQLSAYFKPNDNLYAGKGCSNCAGSGYKGRTAVFEILEITPAMQELLVTVPPARDIEALARKQGNLPMFADGIMKAKSGLTTLKELLRVVEPPRVRVK